MNNTIKYFMWGYQKHFVSSAIAAAQNIFKQLDVKLFHNVFLIGILVEDLEDSYPICIEPEDCGYNIKIFKNIKEYANHFEAIDEENNVFHSHPVAQERHEQAIKNKSYQKAIKKIIRESNNLNDVVSFVSLPVKVQGYMVCVVLQLNEKCYSNYYSLNKDKVDNRYRISTSLIDATIKEYLDGCADALLKPDPGSRLSILNREYEEIIRSAGRRLMFTPGWAGNTIHGLYDACNMISSLKYEGIDGNGKMLISSRGHSNIETIIELESPVSVNNYRAVRKLLEMSSSEFSILSDANKIYGFGNLTGNYDQNKENLFSINFKGYYSWELEHDNHKMMFVKNGKPKLSKTVIEKSKFKNSVKRILNNANEEDLWEIVIEATKQKHGTMIVISNGAKDEAKRLKNQSTKIKPIQITNKIVNMLTSIDGAVLIDPKGVCHAIGVILDGMASEKGTSARGARYNSAIRYIETSNYPTLAVVISEDSTVNLIPDLMPQISKSRIIEKIDILERLQNEEDNISVKKFNHTMDWLTNYSFYLDKDMCEKINTLKKEIQPKLDTDMKILYPDLTPNEEMNETYFIEND